MIRVSLVFPTTATTCISSACPQIRLALIRTNRFYNARDLVLLFKAHMLSFIEYRTSAIYHATSTDLAPLDNVLTRFVTEAGITELDALFHFNLAPLSVRRGISMLGVIHRTVLGDGPPQFRKYFHLDAGHVSGISIRHADNKHSKQLHDPRSASSLDVMKRSALGLIGL